MTRDDERAGSRREVESEGGKRRLERQQVEAGGVPDLQAEGGEGAGKGGSVRVELRENHLAAMVGSCEAQAKPLSFANGDRQRFAQRPLVLPNYQSALVDAHAHSLDSTRNHQQFFALPQMPPSRDALHHHVLLLLQMHLWRHHLSALKMERRGDAWKKADFRHVCAGAVHRYGAGGLEKEAEARVLSTAIGQRNHCVVSIAVLYATHQKE